MVDTYRDGLLFHEPTSSSVSHMGRQASGAGTRYIWQCSATMSQIVQSPPRRARSVPLCNIVADNPIIAVYEQNISHNYTL
jgi:hypothetical protein